MTSPTVLEPQRTLEMLDQRERRTIFSVAAIGDNLIYTADGPDIDVTEIEIFPNGANTVTVLVDDLPVSPPWPLADKQFLSDPGFSMAHGGSTIKLRTTAVTPVIGIVRTTVRQRC